MSVPFPIAVKGQTLTVNAIFPCDLTGATGLVIKYAPPSPGIAGQIVAIVDDALNGLAHAKIPAATLQTLGDWAIWGAGLNAEGDEIRTYGAVLRVVAEGTVVA